MAPVYHPSAEDLKLPVRHFISFLNSIPPRRLMLISIIIPFLLLTAISLAPLGLNDEMRYSLAILVCVSTLWTFGMVPLAVTALLVPVLLVGFGIFSPKEALSPFADPVVYLLVGGLIIAETFRRNGMDKRLAYYLVHAAGGDLKRTTVALMATAAILSMWISNTATVALLIPVVTSVASQAGNDSRKVAGFLLISVSMATAFGSLSTIVGSPTNAITSGLLAKEISWTFIDWAVIGVPVALMSLLLALLLLPKVLRPPKKRLDIAEVDRMREKLGPVGHMEKAILVVFSFTILAWMFGEDIADVLGIPGGLMNSGIIALMSAVVMFLIGAVRWEDAKNIAWDVFLIIGAGLALGEALEKTGTAQWMGDAVSSFSGGSPLLITMLIFALITFLLTSILSNTATAAILVPIAISTSRSLDIEPTYLALVVGMVASISLVTPVGTPPVTLAFSTGTFSRADLARSGLAVGLPVMLLIVLTVYMFVLVGIL
ncbi:MAG: SLC13/DASS family transporter [Methanomassiliicoccales archaeon]|nr:MAG: SLC13/DASS family transporter [Methanomassiliicoccales archaeon]